MSRWIHSRRLSFGSLRIALRIMAVAVVVVGPIATAGWALHAPDRVRLGYAELHPDTATGPSAEGVREYLARRNAVVDRLLPNGAGGTRFFEDLGGNAGMAFPNLAAIGLSVSALSSGWPEATELHERAHLTHAFLPDLVARLMAALPRPAAHEYAATSAREHFAEMAATAWRIVAPPAYMCVDGTPMARLHDAEARVPGTAGFVVWYLRHLSREDVDHHDELAGAAAMLAEPYRTRFDAMSQAIDQRRLPGGDMRPWEHATMRSYVEGWQAELRASDRRFDRLGSYLLVPSLLVMGLWDTMPL